MSPLSNLRAGIREAPFHAAVAAVEAHKSIEVLGTRGSGRTTFLDRVAARLADDGWQVLRVTGVASLRQHALGALQAAGLAGVRQPRTAPTTLATATAELVEAVTPHSVVVVDDWDELDEASWGVLVSLHARSRVPLVVARLSCRFANRTPTGIAASGLWIPLTIEMRPVVYEEVRRLIEEVLGAQASSDLVGDVFVQTGGHVGMIIALLDNAVRERRIECRNGVWTQVRALSDPQLRWWFESFLADLGDEARAALEILALSRQVSLAAIHDLVSEAAIEELERRQLVRVIGAEDPLMVVHPPALAEFFADSVGDARRIRVGERLAGLPGVEFAAEVVRRQTFADQAPVLAGVMTSRLQGERVEARARWRADPSVGNATIYLRTLMRDRATAADFDEVVQHTDATGATGMVGLDYLIAQADWRAFREGDLAGAVSVLRAAAAENTSTGMFARAKTVQLSVMLGVVPDDYETRLVADDAHPEDVQAAVEATLALASLANGRLRQAEEHCARIPDIRIASLGIDIDLLRGLIQLQGGHTKEAVRYASDAYRAAADRFHPESLRAFSWMYTRTLVYTRDLSDIEGVLTLMSGVPETPSRGAYQLGLLNHAVVVALLADQPDLARKHIAEMDRLPMPDGPFPGQQRALAHARLQMYEGDARGGARTLRRLADDLWARGLRVAAAQAYLHAHEVDFQPGHLEADLERLAQVDGRLTGLHVDYFTALVHDDVSGLSEVAYEMAENGLLVWALTALQRAAELLKVKDEGSRSGQIDARIRTIQAQLPPGLTTGARGRLLRTRLTAREMEFARHVAAGTANKDIAERMMVSKRTVESAIARIARKLDVRGRSGIADWVHGQPGPTPVTPAVTPGRPRGSA